MSGGASVSIVDTQRIDFTSGVNGRRYCINVALPSRAAVGPDSAVLYVLDGDFYFASAVEAVRAYGNAPGVVVVGIGYPDDPSFVNAVLHRHAPLPAYLADGAPALAASSLERLYDLTLPASEEVLREQKIAGLFAPTIRDVGGLEDFLRTLKCEVMPRVAATVRTNPSNQAIFGHSLGGLAVLHALFTDPGAFRTYIAASPSIWWSRRSVLDTEEAFSAAVCAGSASPRVLVTMGGDEGLVPTLPATFDVDPTQVARAVRDFRMVENARELTARLQNLSGAPSYHVAEYTLFPHLGHGLSPWPAIAYAIQFAFMSDATR